MKNNGILLIMTNPNGWRNPKVCGGAEVITSSIINKLIDFDWYILLPNQLFDILKNVYSSTHLHYLPVDVLFQKTNVLKDIFQGLLCTLKWVIIGWNMRNKYSLIYSPTTNFSDIFPAKLISTITRKPYIVKYHISIYDESKVLSIYKNFRKEKNTIIDSFIRAVLARMAIIFMSKAKVNIVVCKYLGEQLAKCGINSETIKLNYNGIDFEKIKTYYDKNIKKKYDLCFIGRIEKNKGLLDIIEVVDKIKKQKSDILTVIIGDGSYLQEIKNIIRDRGLEKHIRITGFLGSERYKYLQESCIFISPTYAKEGFGLTLLEALFFNVPVVAYSNPIFKEIFAVYDSVKLIQQNISILEDTILELLQNKDNSRPDVSNYSLNKCVEREKLIISEII